MNRFFNLYVHAIVFTMILGGALGAAAEHARLIVVGLLFGASAGLGITGFIRLMFSID
jgi:hypothetical protein